MEPPPLLSMLPLLALWMLASWAWGRAFLPLSRHLFPNLLDGGLAAGRLLALVLVALFAFEAAHFHVISLQFSPLLMLAAPLALQFFVRRDAARMAEHRAWARSKSRELAASDAIFILAWLFFAWIRAKNPALSDLEKPMDAGLLASATRASWLPFENWWMSGVRFTNYYYFFPVMGSLPARALGTPPHIAYNLVQPLFCALFASILAALCASLCRPRNLEARRFSGAAWARGAWAMAIVSILGNYEPLRQMKIAGHWIWPWPSVHDGAPVAGLDWWPTSRVIQYTINEYPAFTQATGDIHAHFYALSIAALLFSLAWSLFAQPEAPQVLEPVVSIPPAQRTQARQPQIAEAPDPPRASKPKPKSKKRRSSHSRQKARAETAASVSTATIEAPWEPELEESALDTPLPAPRLVRNHDEAWTLRWARVLCIGALLGASIVGNTWDLPLYALLSAACLYLSQPLVAGASSKGRVLRFAGEIGVALGVAILLALPYLARFRSQVSGVHRELWLPDRTEWALMWAGIVGLALISAGGARLVRDDRRMLWQVLAACGALALVAPSFFYIKGAFGDGDYRHQDTVFKFGLQAWLLLGTAGACGAWWLLDASRKAVRRIGITLWIAAWAIPALCTAGVVWTRAMTMASPIAPSLDGSFPIADAKAIAWLSDNAPRGSVVLEAAKPDGDYYNYNEFGRVASLTGVPTSVGWTGHLGYWGADFGRDVLPRLQAVRAAWAAPDADAARQILRSLRITHIFIGEIERAHYTPQAIAMMRSLGQVAFDDGATVIEISNK